MLLHTAKIVLVLLLIPLIGNFTISGWMWDPLDFIIMGGLLFGTGVLLQLAVAHITKSKHKMLACFLILLGLLAIWAELAVDAVSRLVIYTMSLL